MTHSYSAVVAATAAAVVIELESSLQLRKSLRTPEFPPKRLRNTSHKLLEERREGLEAYLQHLTRTDPLPTTLLEFLQLSPGDLT